MEKQRRSVVHLELPGGRHCYYGNVKAMCDDVAYEDLGMSYNYIRNNLTMEESLTTRTGCIIRKGYLITSPKESTLK